MRLITVTFAAILLSACSYYGPTSPLMGPQSAAYIAQQKGQIPPIEVVQNPLRRETGDGASLEYQDTCHCYRPSGANVSSDGIPASSFSPVYVFNGNQYDSVEEAIIARTDYLSSSSVNSPTGTRPHCAENGSCYGDISSQTGRPRTVYVQGYYRSDGTYVRGHYRSRPRN